MHASRIELLQQMPVFGGVRADALGILLAEAATVEVAAQAFFFREGDPAVSMFVLERGHVAVLRTWQGRELVLSRFDQGDCFGEMALLDLFPRSASVRAETDCTVIELTTAHLYRLYERDAAQFAMVQMNIAREISRRLRETAELLFRARMAADPSAPADGGPMSGGGAL